jgi:hypothetical protein
MMISDELEVTMSFYRPNALSRYDKCIINIYVVRIGLFLSQREIVSVERFPGF